MTIQEFQQEVESAENISPEAKEEYNSFRRYQQMAIDMLRELHRVCEGNGIPYQLAYGSLLGAVRDGGQIPWDYDVDVFVPYCEKDRLIDTLRRELAPAYYFDCPENNPKCRHFFLRLSPKGFRSEVLHVDVFYIIGAPDEDPLAYGKRVLRLVRLRFAKLVNVRMETHGDPKRAIRWTLRKIKYLSQPIRRINEDFENLCTKYDCYHARNLLSIDEWLDRQVLHPKIWDTTLLHTVNGDFRVAACYDELLTTMYGDYHKIAPLAKRIEEFRYSYRRLKYFEENWS